jgi:YidC/Oxa1 family membrane protein insertase
MFETLVSKPIFNLLTFIYAYLPGHNLGLAIILFTLVIRIALWPLLKKQLHSSKAIRELQPELKAIKKETKGNKQKESELTMQLYKERGINPFSSLGTAVLQLPILLALFSGIRKIIAKPENIVSYSYGFIQHTAWMSMLATNIGKLDMTLFGFVDLTRKAIDGGHIYWPAMIIVLASAVVQYLSSAQLMVTYKEARSLRTILREASSGTEADQAEVNAATMRLMKFFIPALILFTTVKFAAALGLYWFVSGLIQYIQQSYILRQDAGEISHSSAMIDDKKVVTEVISPVPSEKNKRKSAKTSKTKKSKRR